MAVVNAILRTATEADVPCMSELENLAFERSNWPEDTFLRYDCTVAELDGQIIGFVVARQTFGGSDTAAPEREILNLAVNPAYRRAGLATQLLQAEFQHHATFLLEVRKSNHAARALYEQLGFCEIAQRRDYYDNPPETAIVMLRKCPADAGKIDLSSTF